MVVRVESPLRDAERFAVRPGDGGPGLQSVVRGGVDHLGPSFLLAHEPLLVRGVGRVRVRVGVEGAIHRFRADVIDEGVARVGVLELVTRHGVDAAPVKLDLFRPRHRPDGLDDLPPAKDKIRRVRRRPDLPALAAVEDPAQSQNAVAEAPGHQRLCHRREVTVVSPGGSLRQGCARAGKHRHPRDDTATRARRDPGVPVRTDP